MDLELGLVESIRLIYGRSMVQIHPSPLSWLWSSGTMRSCHDRDGSSILPSQTHARVAQLERAPGFEPGSCACSSRVAGTRCFLAQMGERRTVNAVVPGSSPGEAAERRDRGVAVLVTLIKSRSAVQICFPLLMGHSSTLERTADSQSVKSGSSPLCPTLAQVA